MRISVKLSRGLSLLELLVAVAIMAMAVAVLYRVLGSSVRNVSMLQGQQAAVLLAHSILGAKDAVAEQGWNESGESAGYLWQVRTSPYGALVQPGSGLTPLHLVQVAVEWKEGVQTRRVEFATLRPQRRPVTVSGGGS